MTSRSAIDDCPADIRGKVTRYLSARSGATVAVPTASELSESSETSEDSESTESSEDSESSESMESSVRASAGVPGARHVSVDEWT
jgi:hypothetical protein